MRAHAHQTRSLSAPCPRARCVQHPLFQAKMLDGLLRNAAQKVPKDVFEKMAAAGSFDAARSVLRSVSGQRGSRAGIGRGDLWLFPARVH